MGLFDKVSLNITVFGVVSKLSQDFVCNFSFICDFVLDKWCQFAQVIT